MHCCIVKTKYPAQPCLKTRNSLTKHCQTSLIHSIPLGQFQTNRLCKYEFSLYHYGIFGKTVLVFWKCCQQGLWHFIASKLHPSYLITSWPSTLRCSFRKLSPHSILSMLPMSVGFCMKKTFHISDVVLLWRNFLPSVVYNHSQRLALWYLIAVKLFEDRVVHSERLGKLFQPKIRII